MCHRAIIQSERFGEDVNGQSSFGRKALQRGFREALSLGGQTIKIASMGDGARRGEAARTDPCCQILSAGSLWGKPASLGSHREWSLPGSLLESESVPPAVGWTVGKTVIQMRSSVDMRISTEDLPLIGGTS